MPDVERDQHGGRSGQGWLATVGLVLLSVLCCGLPLLVAAGAVGSVLRGPLVIGAGLLVLLGLVVWAVRRPR